MAGSCPTRFSFMKISTLKRLTLVLKKGEVVFDKDANELFYGDGVTAGGLPFAGDNYVTAQTAVDLQITNQNFIRVTGNNPVTLTLPSAGSKPIVIKHTGTAVLTILPFGGVGTVNGVPSIEIEPLLVGGFAEGNLGASRTFIFEGGQFWIN